MCSLALIHVFFSPYRDNDSTLRSDLLSPLFVCACVYWWQWQVVFCIDCDTSLAVTAAAEYLRSGPSGSSKTCLQSSGSPWWGTAVWSKLLRLDTSCSLLWAFCHVLLSINFKICLFCVWARRGGGKATLPLGYRQLMLLWGDQEELSLFVCSSFYLSLQSFALWLLLQMKSPMRQPK